MCLGGLSKGYNKNSRKDTGLYGSVYDISVAYSTITNDNNKIFTTIKFFSSNVLNVNSLECVSMKNQECKTKTKTIDINNDEPVFYPFSIKVNKCD